MTVQPYADAARAYAAKGWFPIPVSDEGGKAGIPTGVTGHKGRDVTDMDIARWTKDRPGANIALRLAPDMIAIDVDDYDDKPGGATIAELQARLGTLPPTIIATARDLPSGKMLYRVPNGTRLKAMGPGIDLVQHHHRYVVAAPSRHHSGRPVLWLSSDGEELDDIPDPDDIPDLPWTWLEEFSGSGSGDISDAANDATVAAWLDNHDEDMHPGMLEAVVDRVLNSIDAGNSRHDTMVDALCQVARESTAGAFAARDALGRLRDIWDRATAGEDRTDEFVSMTAWAVGQLATTDATTRVAAKRAELEEYTAIDTLDTITPAEVDAATGEVTRPMPLDERRQLPSWPVHCLPDWMANHIKATAKRLRTPVDLPAQFALGALSAVCMGNVTVSVEAVGWSEPVNLYLWCAMPSGAGKSPTEKAITGPLLEWERRRRDDGTDDHQIARAEWRVLQKKAKEAEQSAVMGSNPDGRGILMEAVVAANIPEPKPFRLTADDATPQVLVQLLGHHRRLAVISAEGGLFDTVAGQFGKNASNANVDVYLKAWSGDTIQRDRVGGESGAESVRIDNPLLTMALAMQPSLIERYQSTSPELRGRGFFARFMPSIPTLDDGPPPGLLDGGALDEAAQDDYAATLISVADTLGGGDVIDLTLDPEATALFAEWHDRVGAEVGVGRRLHSLSEMAPKIRSSVLRTAGLLAMAGDQSTVVSADATRRAIEIGEYWIAHALEMERTADPLEQVDAETIKVALRVKAWAERAYIDRGVVEFRPRDVYRGVSRGMDQISSVEDLADGFALLERRGWLRFTKGDVTAMGVRGSVVRAALTTTALTECDVLTSGQPITAESDGTLTESERKASQVPFSLKGEKEDLSIFSRTREGGGGEGSRTAPTTPFSNGHPEAPDDDVQVLAPTGTDTYAGYSLEDLF